jgi:hypothetical protein
VSEVNVFPESVASMTLVYRPPPSALPPVPPPPLELVAPGGQIVRGEHDVAAGERLAVAKTRGGGLAAKAGSCVAERLGAVVDARCIPARIDGRVVAVHEPLEPAPVGDRHAGESRMVAEFGEALLCLSGGWPAQPGVLVVVDHREQVLGPGEGLFGFDFGAEA